MSISSNYLHLLHGILIKLFCEKSLFTVLKYTVRSPYKSVFRAQFLLFNLLKPNSESDTYTIICKHTCTCTCTYYFYRSVQLYLFYRFIISIPESAQDSTLKNGNHVFATQTNFTNFQVFLLQKSRVHTTATTTAITISCTHRRPTAIYFNAE